MTQAVTQAVTQDVFLPRKETSLLLVHPTPSSVSSIGHNGFIDYEEVFTYFENIASKI